MAHLQTMLVLSPELFVEVLEYLGGTKDPRSHARAISRAFADAYTVGRFKARVFPPPQGTTWALLELHVPESHKQVWSFQVEHRDDDFQVHASFLDWSPSRYRSHAVSDPRRRSQAEAQAAQEGELGAAHDIWRALLKTETLEPVDKEDDALGKASLMIEDAQGVRKQAVNVAQLAEVVGMLGKSMHGVIGRRRLPESAAWRRARALSA